MNLIGDGEHARVVRTLDMARNDGWIVAVGDNRDRKKEAEAWEHRGCIWNMRMSSTAICGPLCEVGDGTVIMAGVVMQNGCKIGRHVILNSGCIIDHDCIIEDYAHIAPGAVLAGRVHVGEGALVGTGVALAPGTRVPSWTLVKMQPIVMEPMCLTT